MFTTVFDVRLTQLVDLGNPSKGSNKISLRVYPPLEDIPATVGDMYNRAARLTDHQLTGRWGYFWSNKDSYYHQTLGGASKSGFLYWRYFATEAELRFYQIEPGYDPVLAATLRDAMMTARGALPRGGAKSGGAFIENVSSPAFLRRGSATWNWEQGAGAGYGNAP